MDLLTSIILGTLQGLTEFLPVSSSGHLVLAERILGSKASTGLVFEVMVHFATMVSVVIYFRKRVLEMILSIIPPYTEKKKPVLRIVGIIIIGTIPAVVMGLGFEDKIEMAFGSAKIAALMLVITSLILLSTRLRKQGDKRLSFGTGFLIGIAQSLALMPGISRSGTTISAGLHLKINPAEAAEFSFLLSLPAVFGATILKSFDLFSEPAVWGSMGSYLAGTIAAFIVGYISIAWLMKLIRRGRFFYFGVYCMIVGIAGLIWL